MKERIKAYWFSDGDKLRYNDPRIPAVGVTHTHDGPLVLCRSGLHASESPLDALEYAPGPVLWIVELGGEIIRGDDKIVASERTYIARIEMEPLLREYARWCALQCASAWDMPAEVRAYLETGDPALRSAAEAASWSAAWSAARSAARSAAESAAEAASWSAAESAAWSAAEAASWSAAESAAWSAARSAARSAAESAARSAAWSAAEAASWSAAESAAWSAARSAQLAKMVEIIDASAKTEAVK